MPTLIWDQNYLKSLDILRLVEGDESVKIWRQNASTGLSLSRLVLCTLSPMFKEMLQEICPCHSVSLVMPDNKKLEENSRDTVTDILNLLLTSPTYNSSKPLGNTFNKNLEKEEEVVMITGCVNSLVIDDQPEQSYASTDSSDEDIFLTDNEEVDETIPVVSPIVGNKLTESTEKRKLSESFSNDSQNERVDKELECDLDGDESLNQESSSIISSIIEDLLQFVVLVTAKDESFNLDDENSSGEESFGDCWEEYEDDEDSDMFEEDSESDDEDESDPSWQADHSEDEDEEEEEKTEEPGTKSLKSENKNPSLVKERLDSSGMDSGSLSFYMSDTGPIAIQVRCGCKGTCFRNCSCKSAGADCSRWCGCDPQKCKSKLSQKQGLNQSGMKNTFLLTDNQQDGETDTLIKTPEFLPPPLSGSTTGRRKKKLFTQSLGPQEFD